MRTDITRLDVRGRQWSLVGYSLGLAIYVLIVVALYPAFKDSASLDKLIASDSTAAALFGVTGKISTSGGWLNGNIYANFLPLVVLLVTVSYGAAALAGQDEDGTLCLLATLALRRASIVLQKVGALVLLALVVTFAAGLCVFAGRWFELSVSVGNVMSVSAATLLMGVDFGLVAMAAGALTGSRGAAIGIGTALAAASYLVGSLAAVVSWIHPARYASLFYWSVGDNQITYGVGLADYAVLLAVGAVLTYAAVLAFERLDLR